MDMKRILQAMDGVATKPVEGGNDMKKFLQVVTEGANPHKVSLPVQMAMQHYQQPEVKPAVVEKKPSLLKQYFQETEDNVAEQIAEEEAIKQQRVRMYSQKIAERVLMKESRTDEAPIEMTGDANDPVVHSHAKANPMSLKGRIQQARNQLKELANMAESDDLVVWQKICQLSKGGMFMGLEQNIEQVRHGIEQLAAKRKQGGVASRGIDKGIGEGGDDLDKYDTGGLQGYYSDFHKDLHGFRPRHHSEEEFNNPEKLKELIRGLHKYMDMLKQSPEGRAQLKADGWQIDEDSDPCWKDYKQVGMKKKGGKKVPNCVPKE